MTSNERILSVSMYGAPNFGILKEVIGDIFESEEALCHCVSKDFRMSKGIAKVFREKFKKTEQLKKSNTGVGDVAIIKHEGRYIYNLVTKERYFHKPTYTNLKKSIKRMKEHAVKNGIDRMSMPKIGCGLDGLEWEMVKEIIKETFYECSTHITVFSLEENPKKKLKSNVNYKYTEYREM